MYGQSRLFIHDEEVIVFEEDFQRDILWHEFEGFRLRKVDVDGIVHREFHRTIQHCPVSADAALVEEFLYLVSARRTWIAIPNAIVAFQRVVDRLIRAYARGGFADDPIPTRVHAPPERFW
jgi:hypothetical protein